jgi:hypothetical protein
MKRSSTRKSIRMAVTLLIGCTLLREALAFNTGASSSLFIRSDQVVARVRIGQAVLFNSKNDEDELESVETIRGQDNFDDLQPPPFNLRKESLLFDENATTRQDSNVRRLWLACQQNLPQIVHGTREGIDPEPLGALYNVMFVRIPAIVAGIVYCYNFCTGHPLIVDVGDGAFEMQPIIVVGVLYVLLLL